MSVHLEELRQRRHVALDLDVVVYRGRRPLDGSAEAVSILRDEGFSVTFCTNGSSRSCAEVAAKLVSMGIPCQESEVITSGILAASAARDLCGPGARIHVVGTTSLQLEVHEMGFKLVGVEEAVEGIIVGLDPSFTYERLGQVMRMLLRGAALVGCNRDARFPSDAGLLQPGSGPLLAAIEAASGRQADVVVGKPSPLMLEALTERTHSQTSDWFIVGDSVEADMGLATQAGVPGVLVGHDAGYRDLTAFVNELVC